MIGSPGACSRCHQRGSSTLSRIGSDNNTKAIIIHNCLEEKIVLVDLEACRTPGFLVLKGSAGPYLQVCSSTATITPLSNNRSLFSLWVFISHHIFIVQSSGRTPSSHFVVQELLSILSPLPLNSLRGLSLTSRLRKAVLRLVVLSPRKRSQHSAFPFGARALRLSAIRRAA